MTQEKFELAKLLLQIGLLLITAFAMPALREFLLKNTTAKQREEILFWTKYAVVWAEDIYKQKGAGKLKKLEVVKWLQKQKIPLTAEQMDVLIDMIVKEFNKNGWDKVLEEV